MIKLAPFIVLFPLVGAILNGALAYFNKRVPEKTVGWLACGMMALSFIIAAGIFFQLAGLPADDRSWRVVLWPWVTVGGLDLYASFLIDPLSVVMMLVVTGVGLVIHIYSTGYMSHDEGFTRFFAYLNLFCFAMLLLVMGENMLMMFIGWEGVGLCSYLLIGFWFTDPAKAAAGMKAFIVNRIGDFGFIVGTILLFWTLHSIGHPTLRFWELERAVPLLIGQQWLGISVITLAAILLFVGATGKSAQIPLYVWLPDAMAGPTPVSALIHAATMVTAGVYMIARMNFLFSLSPTALAIVATVGTATALFAATIGFAQNDIKKVLAYSTVSQLGTMFAAMGAAAYTAGIFHLVTHAFFKACLFLGSGSVIHAMGGEQDMRKMGGLKKYLPRTYPTFLIATLAIAGIFPFAGFFSKDEILWKSFQHGGMTSFYYFLWLLQVIAAACTAIYMFRAVCMTFYGELRSTPKAHHPPPTPSHQGRGDIAIHESPAAMTIPLIILAALSIVGGFLGFPHFSLIEQWLEPVFAAVPFQGLAEHGINWVEFLLMFVSLGVAVGASTIGFTLYTTRYDIVQKITARIPLLARAAENKYYIDEIYQATAVRLIMIVTKISNWFDANVIDGLVNLQSVVTRGLSDLSGRLDHGVVDGAVNLVSNLTLAGGRRTIRLQTGRIQNYLYVIVGGVVGVMVVRMIMD